MKKEDIINKNMQWRLCDCNLKVGQCLCKLKTEDNDEKN
jgi:hypothetical protein